MCESEKGNVKKLFSQLSEPVKKILGFSCAVFGLNIFQVIGLCAIIASKRDFFEKYFELILGLFIGCFFLMIISCFLIIVALCCTLFRGDAFSENLAACKANCDNIRQRLEEIEQKGNVFSNDMVNFSRDTNRLNVLVTEMEIAGDIINKKELMKIEENVPNGTDIIIFLSKNQLDVEFKPIIVNNIKRNITYKYIVSKADSSGARHMLFMQIVKEWHDYYKKSFTREKKATFFHKERKKNYSEEDCDEYFYSHVKEYCSPVDSDLITIMLYRRKEGLNRYQVIVNLPINEKEYYSYKLPDNSDTGIVMESILSMCNKDKEYNYRGEINEH